jgi:hypothetical protein
MIPKADEGSKSTAKRKKAASEDDEDEEDEDEDDEGEGEEEDDDEEEDEEVEEQAPKKVIANIFQRSIVRGVQVLPKKAAKAQVLIQDHFVVSGSCLNAESRWEDFKCRSWEAPTDGASSKGFNPIILFECGSVRCEGSTANEAGCLKGFNQISLCGERYLFECRVPMGSKPLVWEARKEGASSKGFNPITLLHQRFQSKINLCERHLLG